MRMSRKTKWFLHEVRRAALMFAAYAGICLLAVFAICFVLSIPEIIGALIFGW